MIRTDILLLKAWNLLWNQIPTFTLCHDEQIHSISTRRFEHNRLFAIKGIAFVPLQFHLSWNYVFFVCVRGHTTCNLLWMAISSMLSETHWDVRGPIISPKYPQQCQQQQWSTQYYHHENSSQNCFAHSSSGVFTLGWMTCLRNTDCI